MNGAQQKQQMKEKTFTSTQIDPLEMDVTLRIALNNKFHISNAASMWCYENRSVY